MTTELQVGLCCRSFEGAGGQATPGSDALLRVPMSGAYAVTATIVNGYPSGGDITAVQTTIDDVDLNTGDPTVVDWTSSTMGSTSGALTWNVDGAGTDVIVATVPCRIRLTAALLLANDTATGANLPSSDMVAVLFNKNGGAGELALPAVAYATFPLNGQAAVLVVGFDDAVAGDTYGVVTGANGPIDGPVTLWPIGAPVPNTYFAVERLSYGGTRFELRVYDAFDNYLRTADTCTLPDSAGTAKLAHAAVMIPAGGCVRVFAVLEDGAPPLSIGDASHLEAVRVAGYADPASCDGGGGGG